MYLENVLGLALGMVLGPVVADASVIFTNITTLSNGGVIIEGSATVIPEAFAGAFTPSATYSLTDAQAMLDSHDGLPGGQANFAIYSDSNDAPAVYAILWNRYARLV